MSECKHEGWGQYAGEEGPCPPPAALQEIDGGVECPACKHHIRALPMSRMFAERETATLTRETR